MKINSFEDMFNKNEITNDKYIETQKNLQKIIDDSKEILNFWKNPDGWAPTQATKLLKNAKLDWLEDLTNCLKIWIDKRYLTNGELLLARANLGSLVEGWLKLFYCIYLNDYKNDGRSSSYKKMKRVMEPNELKFDTLRQFSNTVLWEKNDEWDKWVLNVQQKRNAIHAFNDREIGTTLDFMNDIEKFYEFIDLVDSRLPYPS